MANELTNRRLSLARDHQAYWREYLDWMTSSFNLYLQAQESRGLSKEQALKQLSQIWEREDQERLEAIARAGKIAQRGG